MDDELKHKRKLAAQKKWREKRKAQRLVDAELDKKHRELRTAEYRRRKARQDAKIAVDPEAMQAKIAKGKRKYQIKKYKKQQKQRLANMTNDERLELRKADRLSAKRKNAIKKKKTKPQPSTITAEDIWIALETNQPIPDAKVIRTKWSSFDVYVKL